ncbi:hypothetical protein CYFUS_009805 [Cystobacter fuscus]|uniref:Uncharacterized protein n=1 Tax=Cystobacter fuscus TaxID=43 RepID=A0A250JL07_9BACT|nr:hypothetical protein CYFUS_009805 [Cystobacter fuscus]
MWMPYLPVMVGMFGGIVYLALHGSQGWALFLGLVWLWSSRGFLWGLINVARQPIQHMKLTGKGGSWIGGWDRDEPGPIVTLDYRGVSFRSKPSPPSLRYQMLPSGDTFSARTLPVYTSFALRP